MRLSLEIKPYSFKLIRSIKTSQGSLEEKQGWLLKLRNNHGACGWGEISPLKISEFKVCQTILNKIGCSPLRNELEEIIRLSPPSLGFGIGAALAELDLLIDLNCNKAPKSAFLLPDNNLLLDKLDAIIHNFNQTEEPLTLKWKIARDSDDKEQALLEKILKKLPGNSLLRLDANTGWDRSQAHHWVDNLLQDTRIEWLEQPLPTNDTEGLFELSKKIPVALDESLVDNPSLKNSWKSWQIRRPSLDGDPRIILKELREERNNLVISTTFETGIGLRWVNHLAALQQKSSSPTASGLAPGWCPKGKLFSHNPKDVWEAV
tara:strand:- start:43272 stop:44228 length:957 start_codon:yes stop_codon:yes gene_type:complete